MNDAILKLQESEKRAEQERALAEAQQKEREPGFGLEDHPPTGAIN